MIRLQADWARPFAARNFNIFTLEPQGNATRVTWALNGENVFMLKLMTIFVSADRLMGNHFEKGLADLKAFARKMRERRRRAAISEDNQHYRNLSNIAGKGCFDSLSIAPLSYA